ncbi:hypothetical protein MCRH_1585 [Moraxella catarrhalis RH4]|uniref:hypothetical protein n=1 Tax=Moraxella catarrhalis TaxID=480 RepID=UPI0002A2A7A1|nr:hypothetical protein [Moraxella catarrhalis]EKF82989.1 hypothetical protein MCRH_1585 [Moraxella catarrhalis RH4]
MGNYHACHIATNGMMARLGNMLGGADYPTISQKQHKKMGKIRGKWAIITPAISPPMA